MMMSLKIDAISQYFIVIVELYWPSTVFIISFYSIYELTSHLFLWGPDNLDTQVSLLSNQFYRLLVFAYTPKLNFFSLIFIATIWFIVRDSSTLFDSFTPFNLLWSIGFLTFIQTTSFFVIFVFLINCYYSISLSCYLQLFNFLFVIALNCLDYSDIWIVHSINVRQYLINWRLLLQQPLTFILILYSTHFQNLEVTKTIF